MTVVYLARRVHSTLSTDIVKAGTSGFREVIHNAVGCGVVVRCSSDEVASQRGYTEITAIVNIPYHKRISRTHKRSWMAPRLQSMPMTSNTERNNEKPLLRLGIEVMQEKQKRPMMRAREQTR